MEDNLNDHFPVFHMNPWKTRTWFCSFLLFQGFFSSLLLTLLQCIAIIIPPSLSQPGIFEAYPLELSHSLIIRLQTVVVTQTVRLALILGCWTDTTIISFSVRKQRKHRHKKIMGIKLFSCFMWNAHNTEGWCRQHIRATLYLMHQCLKSTTHCSAHTKMFKIFNRVDLHNPVGSRLCSSIFLAMYSYLCASHLSAHLNKEELEETPNFIVY